MDNIIDQFRTNTYYLISAKQKEHAMEFIVPLVLLIVGCIIISRRALAAYKDEVKNTNK
ncbi:hypothetical protein [Shewanella sp. 10N.286.48.A6]|uniref:hypothetical protein n=1 Tax=Shewanella sp. 10N.286.48.A6 TaxID=1880833 RepID=UPI0039A77960